MTNNFKPVCDTMTEHQPIVEELIALLKSRPDLAVALKESIRKADRPDVATLAQYNDFLNLQFPVVLSRGSNQVCSF